MKRSPGTGTLGSVGRDTGGGQGRTSVRGRATAEERSTEGEGSRRIARLLREGFLTEAEAYEVNETISLVARRVEEGSITRHFAELVIRKLADDMSRSWEARATR